MKGLVVSLILIRKIIPCFLTSLSSLQKKKEVEVANRMHV